MGTPSNSNVAGSGTIVVQPTAAGTWYLHVQGFNGAGVANGTYDYSVSTKAATAITAQPQAADVCAGAAVSFSVGASGEGTLTYQWQKDGEDIPDATSATLDIADAGSAAAGNYRCIITGECGSATSDTAALTVRLYIVDFDEDCDTDLVDFSFFQSCFNGPNQSPAAGCSAPADLDGDSDVDLVDFASFQSCFNGPNREPLAGCPLR